ncbi:MAG: 23S rRNA (pseudouridine(1915)-N(3))-methyltransferase RlmH [Oscillospiraceae bacterium]|jgi:23S rRNA (pseudouridine1915-N3)-methyltransferase|nr:23S rRNA (pseudouridine(1915)-N(3))-methyltransferase RlmH [Oscillospiraceae bacterium]
MLRVQLIVFGKCKEVFWREACGEYEKRLRGFCRLETAELPPAPLPERPSPAQIAGALSAEGALAGAVLAKLPPQTKTAALCVEGQAMSSEAFACWLDEAAGTAGSVALLIGSSCGLDGGLKARTDLRLSLSAMTFPHQLARVLLLEQLYRAFQIRMGGKYHK